MENLLDKLTKQAKCEARDALRLVVMTLNGLAGVHALSLQVCGRDIGGHVVGGP
jgi:hypothetical protein